MINTTFTDLLIKLNDLKKSYKADYIKVYYNDLITYCVKFIKNNKVIAIYRSGKRSFDNKGQ